MHPPGAYFFVLENPKGNRAQNHSRKKQNLGVEPNDAQSVGDEYAKANRKPCPGFAEQDGNCPNPVFFITLDVFEVLDGERNHESDDEQPKNLGGKQRNVLVVSQKNKTARKQENESQSRKKTSHNRESFESEGPAGIHPANNLIDEDQKKKFHSDRERQNKG